MTNIQKMKLQQAVMRKLLGAIAMLLVATVMLGASTYAWFVLSTAPETREMRTTAGANGYLEIALQRYIDDPINPGRAPITSEVGKSNAVVDAREANLHWGNIVSLSDEYGLEAVKLIPARLNLSENNTVKSSKLVIPSYGTDGRISSMNEVGYVHYNGTGYVDGTNYGVNIMCNPNTMDSAGLTTTRITYNRKRVVNDMADYLEGEREQIRSDLVALLENDEIPVSRQADDYPMSNAQAMIIVFRRVNISSSGSVPTQQAQAAFNYLVQDLTVINNRTRLVLRHALMARAAADLTNFPNTPEGQAALEELYSAYTGWDTEDIIRIADQYGYDDIADSDTNTGAAYEVRNIQIGINRANEFNNGGSINNAIQQLVTVKSDFWTRSATGEWKGGNAIQAVQGITALINAKKGDFYFSNGVFQSLAYVLGDYEATLNTTDENDVNWNFGMHVAGEVGVAANKRDGRHCDPENNLGYLNVLYYQIQGYVDEGQDYGAIYVEVESFNTVNAYGYSIDLAFRTNKSGNLMLQTDGLDRVLGLTKQEAMAEGVYTEQLQGSGSNMNYTVAVDMSNRTEGLLKSIYVVFINEYSEILAVASADNVRVDGRKATADLVLYNYTLTDGILKTTTSRSSQVICAMTADETRYVTALVYLNGDTVTAADVSAIETQSLQGKLNMQFSLSGADLVPMDYHDYVESTVNGG